MLNKKETKNETDNQKCHQKVQINISQNCIFHFQHLVQKSTFHEIWTKTIVITLCEDTIAAKKLNFSYIAV